MHELRCDVTMSRKIPLTCLHGNKVSGVLKHLHFEKRFGSQVILAQIAVCVCPKGKKCTEISGFLKNICVCVDVAQLLLSLSVTLQAKKGLFVSSETAQLFLAKMAVA